MHRQATIVAIFRLPLFQRAHSFPQTRDHFFQARYLLLVGLQTADRRAQSHTQILIGPARASQPVLLVLDVFLQSSVFRSKAISSSSLFMLPFYLMHCSSAMVYPS